VGRPLTRKWSISLGHHTSSDAYLVVWLETADTVGVPLVVTGATDDGAEGSTVLGPSGALMVGTVVAGPPSGGAHVPSV
jgi:hypothetical protein